MRYVISERIERLFITTSNVNFFITRDANLETGFIASSSNPNIQESTDILYFSDNDDKKPVTDTRIILPKKKFTSIYLSPFNGNVHINDVWLEELRVRMADDRLYGDSLMVDKIDIRCDRANVDMTLLGSMTDYSYCLDCRNFSMKTIEPSPEVISEKQGSILVKNKGKTNILFKGYRR